VKDPETLKEAIQFMKCAIVNRNFVSEAKQKAQSFTLDHVDEIKPSMGKEIVADKQIAPNENCLRLSQRSQIVDNQSLRGAVVRASSAMI
jgi:hypothetical protein